MGTKMAIAFAVVFMAQIEKQLLTSYKPHKPFLWKIYIDDIFCVWTIPETEINNFNNLVTHCTPVLDSRTKFHQQKLFSSILKFLQDRDFPIAKSLIFKHNASRQKRSNIQTSLHATFSVLRRVFVKWEALRLLRTNSVEELNLPCRTKLPSGPCRKGLSRCTILITQHGFDKPTEII